MFSEYDDDECFGCQELWDVQKDNAALRAKVARYEEALRDIANPIEGTPVGDPWAFYNDVCEYARKALEVPNE